MRIGTKSVLFGAHAFYLHPWFVALAWWKLYGFPFDPRLWVAFFVHDLGYLGKPNMDGPEGETHPELGARIMHALFDGVRAGVECRCGAESHRSIRWHDFCLFHSRFYAKQNGAQPSQLCIADKLAICLTPAWLYLPMVRATGEIDEYMSLAMAMNGQDAGKYGTMAVRTESQRVWYRDVQSYVQRWVDEHKDGRVDTWTPAQKKAQSDSGVWQ